MSATAAQIPRLLTADEVADALRVSRAQVYLLKDRIGYVVIGTKAIRFEPDAVFAYVHAQRRCHAPAPACSAAPVPPSGMPSGPTLKIATTVSPQVAAIMERQRRGLRRAS